MQKCLLIGIGNRLRRDDGVGPFVLDQFTAEHWQKVELLQLTPETAELLSGFDHVVFVDADVSGLRAVTIEPVSVGPAPGVPLTHFSTPEAIVAMARTLFDFRGKAHVCRIPVWDFEFAEGLSFAAQKRAAEAARIIATSFPVDSTCML